MTQWLRARFFLRRSEVYSKHLPGVSQACTMQSESLLGVQTDTRTKYLYTEINK